MAHIDKKNNPKEIDVFNRFSNLNTFKNVLIAVAIAGVMAVVIFFLVKVFSDYTINYETFGGTVMGEELGEDSYKFLQKTREPENLKKEGFYIEGYYTDKNFNHKYEFGKSIWKSRTLYVNWQPGYAVQLFFVDGEDDTERNQAEKTGIDEEYLKMVHEQYVAPDTTYTLPLVYNEVEGNKHFGEQLLWYTSPDATGMPIITKDYKMTDNIKLYGVWFDTSPSKFVVDEEGELHRYLGNCYNIMLPNTVKKFKGIETEEFITGIWNTTNVADGSNYSIFDKVYSDLKRVFINPDCEELGGCAFRGCEKLEEVYFLGNKITFIPEGAFMDCDVLGELTLPTTVTSIGYRAFYNSGLKALYNTQNILTIEKDAFNGCQRLLSIEFNSVTTIKKMAFAACYNLESLYLRTNQVVVTDVDNVSHTDLNNNVLYSSTDCKIYVPENLLSTYQSSFPWNSYSSRIYAIS